jgi:anti-anti-sigma factor
MPSSNNDHISPADMISPAALVWPQNEYVLTRGPDGPVLTAYGEVDLHGKGAFEAALAQVGAAWKEGETLTVEMTGVWFIDSSGLSALLCQWRQLPSGTRFVLRVLQNSLVLRVLSLSKWDSIFDIQTVLTN